MLACWLIAHIRMIFRSYIGAFTHELHLRGGRDQELARCRAARPQSARSCVFWTNIGPELINLMPELARFAPPCQVVDKMVYSPWMEDRLDAVITRSSTDT